MRRLVSLNTVALLVLSLVAVSLAACAVGAPKDPISLVPAGADVLVSVDLPAVLSDEDVQEMYALIAEASGDPDMPATLEGVLALAEEETGLDLTTFGDVLLFADIPDGVTESMTDTDSVDYVGVIAAGAPDGLLDTILESDEEDELTESEYNGVTVLVGADDEMAIAVVDGAAVVGTLQAVHDVIDVAANDAEAISGEILTLYGDLGDVWLKVAAIIPAEVRDEAASADGMEFFPVDVAALLDVSAVGMSANKSGNDGTMRVVLRYATDEQAREVEEVFNSLITLVTTFADDEPMLDQLDMLEISVDGTDVVIEYTQDLQEAMDQLREAIESMGDMSPFGIGL